MMSHFLQQNMTEQEEDESKTDNANVESGEEGELTEPEPVKPDIIMTKGKGNTNSLLEKLSKNVKSKENVGSSVSDELGNIVNDLLSNGMSDDTLKEQKEKYSRPENCTFLTVPKVNEEIWQHAHDTIKSKDIKFQNIQKVLMKGLTVVVELMNKTMVAIENQSAVSRSEILDGLSDAVSFLSSANQEINMRRKELWRPELDESYKALYIYNKPVTTMLFGDNLPQKVKELSDTKKGGRKIKCLQRS